MDGELDQLGERIAEQAAHLDAAMHRLLVDLREFDSRGGWHAQGASSCAHWLAWRVGWDLVTAREHVRVARKIVEFPAVDDALRRGEVSYSKVRALLRVATPANESLLLDHARLMTASQLEKTCRKYALVQRQGQDPDPLDDQQRRHVRRRDMEDGMVKIEVVLHPEEAELVWTMLNHAATQLARASQTLASDGAANSDVVSGSFADGAVALHGNSDAEEGDAEEGDAEEGDAEEAEESDVDEGDDDAGDTADGDTRGADTTNDFAASAVSYPELVIAVLTHDDCPIDDSAESALYSRADALAAPMHIDTCLIDDSAESAEYSGAGALAALAHTDTRPIDDPEIPAPSLLDRLLDEAEALRSHEAVREAQPSTEPEATSHERGASATTSVLRQRDAAARRGFNRADALVSLAQRYLRGDRINRSPIEIAVTISRDSLRAEPIDPVEAGEMGESLLSGQAARRLACDAAVTEVRQDEHGVPLSVGRKRRTISGALKRALHKRDGMCTFPSCTNRIFLEGHHIKHWADGGATSLDNSLLLCSLHHRYVHEYGYTVELGEDQRPQFRDQRGRLLAAVPARPSTTDLGWPRIRSVNEPLGIDAGTIAGPWDGTPVDYGRIVGHLAAADGLR